MDRFENMKWFQYVKDRFNSMRGRIQQIIENIYSYGDGSLNLTSLGYEGKLYVNDTLVKHSNGSYYSGNFRTRAGDCNHLEQLFWATKNCKTIPETRVVSGTNSYILDIDATQEAISVLFFIWAGAWTTGVSIGSLAFEINGKFYNLKEMMETGIIKPLVVMCSCASNGRYYWDNCFNLYTGGTTNSGNYPHFQTAFILNKGYKITRVKLYANKSFSTAYNDCFKGWYSPLEGCQLHIKE